MQFSHIIALLVSATAVQAAAVAEPDARAVIKLLKRQGLTPAQCASSNLIHCNNSNEPCPIGCFCPGGNLPNGGCCAGSCGR
ncbi:hypothetical protein C8034_v003413 [Colletotrichum sidae]|uniref:Uncharacterized protein n=2 Tax=Colletotrichum orbiculare species complex TaxID=2707354 RepID=A0A4R8RF78_COLTR|nr:hypothetical protein CTRI78_v005215 [Colletotrichum trifolii]TEA14297.1 hypothetical protein C8034_v003413 [Colletotrichum sidae]